MSDKVSVIISTYNSSNSVIETLESIANQSYREIELIITDDNSKDSSVKDCQAWLKNNKNRFVNTEIITSNINTGISGNANRGLKISSGNWIKFIAADDTLIPDCIESNMEWIKKNPEIKVLFSDINVYKDTFQPNRLIERIKAYDSDFRSILFEGRNAQSQYKMLLVSDRIHFSPSVFIHSQTIKSIGGFDENYKMLEDYPLWLNLTRNGHKLHYMNKLTVNYRMHSNANNNTGKDWLVNPNYFQQEKFRCKYTYPYLPFEIKALQKVNFILLQIFRIKMINKKKVVFSLLLTFLITYINPFKYYIWLKLHIMPELKKDEFYM